MMCGRHSRGAAELLGVLLLGLAAAAALLLWNDTAAEDRRVADARDRGRLFGMWLEVAHEATMATHDAGYVDYRAALALDPDGFEVVPGNLLGVPAGLPVPDGLRCGVMDDGAGVPMAWCVLAVDDFSRGPARLGGLEAGLAAVGVAGLGGTPMADREAGVAAALGAALGAGNLFATADRGLVYQDEAIYRRAQPGRPWASRMEAELDLGGNDVVGGGDVDANSAEVSGDVESRIEASVAGSVACDGDLAGLGPCDGNVGTLGAEALVGDALRVNEGVVTPVLELANAARVGLPGGTPGNAVVAGRVEGGSLRAVGRVEAGLLVVGGALGGVSTLTSSGGVDAREFEVGSSFVSTGAAGSRVAGVGDMTADTLVGDNIALGGDVFGPFGWIKVTLTVGSCDGC